MQEPLYQLEVKKTLKRMKTMRKKLWETSLRRKMKVLDL